MSDDPEIHVVADVVGYSIRAAMTKRQWQSDELTTSQKVAAFVGGLVACQHLASLIGTSWELAIVIMPIAVFGPLDCFEFADKVRLAPSLLNGLNAHEEHSRLIREFSSVFGRWVHMHDALDLEGLGVALERIERIFSVK